SQCAGDAGWFVQREVPQVGVPRDGAPSTVTRSRGSTRRPSSATSPLTRTRPSPISSSAPRLEPYPARARTRWRRSPSGSRGGIVRGFLAGIVQERRDRWKVGERGQAEPL